MLEGLAEGQAERQLSQYFYETCRGNPFYVKELLSYVQTKGFLLRNDNELSLNSTKNSMIPNAIKSILQSRLSRLTRPGRAFLKVAAVGGVQVPIELVHSVLQRLEIGIVGSMEPIWSQFSDEKLGKQQSGLFLFNTSTVRDLVIDMMTQKRFGADQSCLCRNLDPRKSR